jgi:hypothetical protein
MPNREQLRQGSRRFVLDHANPFALRQDSSPWNLLPTSRQANNARRDRLS